MNGNIRGSPAGVSSPHGQKAFKVFALLTGPVAVLLGAFVVASQAAECNPNANQIALFVDSSYRGRCVVKGVGEYPHSSDVGLANDSISSIRVGANVQAVLCRDANYRGRCELFTAHDASLSDNHIGNDKVSSVKVQKVEKAVLPETIFSGRINRGQHIPNDLDRDGLKDDLEGRLAEYFKPIFRFDNQEGARRSKAKGDSVEEPITLFQVRLKDCVGERCFILIRWVFLFLRDGGYGPTSGCKNDHWGDNEIATYELQSTDSGKSWRLIRVNVGNKFEWPTTGYTAYASSRHPIIYMSAHKHHQYFDTSYDGKDSAYSDVPLWDDCNDDVNGRGAQVVSDLFSVGLTDAAGNKRWNNVGEPNEQNVNNHPVGVFVNDLSHLFRHTNCQKGRHAWSTEHFCSSDTGRNFDKWLKDPITTYRP